MHKANIGKEKDQKIGIWITKIMKPIEKNLNERAQCKSKSEEACEGKQRTAFRKKIAL